MKFFSKFIALGVAMVISPVLAHAVEFKEGEKIAIIVGQPLELWVWSPSGYLHLVMDALAQKGIRHPSLVFLENQKTAQMVERVDTELVSKQPAYVLIMPGSAEYDPQQPEGSTTEFGQNLEKMVGKLQAAHINPILATMYPFPSNLALPANHNVAEHNNVIRSLAQAHQLQLIDFAKIVDETKTTSFDGNPAAKCLVNQIFAAEILRSMGFEESEVAVCRQAWLDAPGAVRFPPSVSVSTYEKLNVSAQASGKGVGAYMTKLLHEQAAP